ncbi:MAG: class I SAM-dependent methyltransferase [Chloroflexota bacterium]
MDNPWWRLVRFGFRLLYNEMAFTYDLVSNIVSLGAWRCWQRAALKHLTAQPGNLILELAHGTGNLQLDLLDAGYRTIGYDLSPYMGRIANAKLVHYGYSAKLVRGKAQELPFPPGAFAAVVSTFPTNFIVQPKTLREVHRILQPKGQFIIVPNGVLTGGGVSGAGIEWLYRVTGQREDSTASFKDFFTPYGFDAEMFTEPCPRSIAYVIVAQKRG